ncbi:MAG TPA: hypothetical protein DDW33_14185 [Ktedonobacter sp.]|nr:hypothetical protein [Ktedonobacter sp.]HBE26821.1 hypothetical protein [Ktedonobacter sp.]HCF85837.1 hypothetical protein [Ktedonobacter sp.]HCP75756.1 hypothetical protein [Ktedonobacter sp.]
MKKSGQAGPPFRHAGPQPAAPSGGRIGGPMGAAPKAQGLKNSALGTGTVGNGGSHGVTLKSMKRGGK